VSSCGDPTRGALAHHVEGPCMVAAALNTALYREDLKCMLSNGEPW